MNELGKFLVVTGIMLTVLGVLIWSGFGPSWLGQLPGDIRFKKGEFSFYFPVVTCLLFSLLLTVILWWVRK